MKDYGSFRGCWSALGATLTMALILLFILLAAFLEDTIFSAHKAFF
jgi:hypothetical protein